MNMDAPIPNYNGYKNQDLDSKDSEYELRSILNGDKNKDLDYNQNDKNGKHYRVDPYNSYQREYREDTGYGDHNPYASDPRESHGAYPRQYREDTVYGDHNPYGSDPRESHGAYPRQYRE